MEELVLPLYDIRCAFSCLSAILFNQEAKRKYTVHEYTHTHTHCALVHVLYTDPFRSKLKEP